MGLWRKIRDWYYDTFTVPQPTILPLPGIDVLVQYEPDRVTDTAGNKYRYIATGFDHHHGLHTIWRAELEKENRRIEVLISTTRAAVRVVFYGLAR